MIGDLATLVDVYSLSAQMHGEYTVKSNYRKANEFHDRLIDSYHRICEFGADGEKALLKLMDHPSPHVQVWAATHSLLIDPDQALIKLHELSKLPGMLGFGAGIVIKEWEKGTLKFA